MFNPDVAHKYGDTLCTEVFEQLHSEPSYNGMRLKLVEPIGNAKEVVVYGEPTRVEG